MSRSRVVPLLVVCAVALDGSARAEEWARAKSDDGVEVWTRPAPGFGMKEFRAAMHVRTTLGSLVALMEDVPAYPRWFADCKEARVLKSQGVRDRHVYFLNGAPFPVRDRDMVTHFLVHQDPDTRVVIMRLRGEPELIAPTSGRVRVPRLEGAWTFTPLGDGIVQVEYQVLSDPGGSLPGWVANMTVADAPWKTLRAMRRMLDDMKYRIAHPEWIIE